MNRGHRFLNPLIIAMTLGTTASAQDITTGLRGYWKLNETSGTTAADSSGYGSSGTAPAGTAWTTACGSTRVFNFNGTGHYITIPNAANLQPSTALTIAGWIKGDAWGAGTDVDVILRKGENNPNNYQLAISDGRVELLLDGNDGAGYRGNTVLSTGVWYHVAATWDGSTVRIYVNGVLNNTPAARTGTIGVDTRPAYIGGRSGTDYFDGMIYDVRLYNRALSQADITYLYGSIGHWKLAETSGTTAADSSHYAKDGTVYGGANWSSRCNGTGVFNFNGSTHYISIGSSCHLQPAAALTIAAWIRGDSWGSADNVDAILRKGEGNPNNYQLAIADGRVALFLDEWDSAGTRGNTVLSVGEWYHVAATWDGANVRIYVNGQLNNTPAARSGTIGTDTRPLYIGGRSGADLFDGMIQDVRIYRTALSASEIARLAGFAGHWRFSEGSGTTAADSSGIGNNATLSGGATWTTDCAGNNNALLTNGSGGIAQTASAFTLPDEGTVAFWMRSNGNPPALGRIFGAGGDWEGRQMTDGTVVFDLCGEGGGHFQTTVPLNEVDRWYHVAATFNSANDTYAIYIDGQLDKSGTNTNAMAQQAAAVLSFGTRTGSTEYWQGALRDFRVYSRRLCPTEIAELYGLIGHWALDESSGTVAVDSSGLGRDATVIGTANWTAGAINNCLQLDGATKAEASSLLGSPKNVTLAGWANLTAADSGGAEVVSLGDYFAIRLDNATTTRTFFYNGSSWTVVAVNQTFTGAGWHHFAAVFNDDQNYCKLFIDGLEAASLSTAVTIPYTGLGTKTVIGRHGNGSTNFDFTGKIDDVRVYNRALCPSEIADLYDLGGGAFGGVKIIKWVEIQ